MNHIYFVLFNFKARESDIKQALSDGGLAPIFVSPNSTLSLDNQNQEIDACLMVVPSDKSPDDLSSLINSIIQKFGAVASVAKKS